MEPVSVALSVVATIDICVNRGHAVVELCRAFKAADIELHNRAVLVEGSIMQTSSQLELIKEMDKDLDDSFKIMQAKLCNIYAAKLNDVITRLEGLIERKIDGNGKSVLKIRKKARFAFFHQFLDAAIDDMERWQGRFDPTWKLVMLRSEGRVIEQAIAKHESTTSEVKSTGELRRLIQAQRHDESSGPPAEMDDTAQLHKMRVHAIRFSPVALYEQSSHKYYIVDTLEARPELMQKNRARAFATNVRTLAQRLQFVDPSRIGLFQCKGFAVDEGVFRFIFRQPQRVDTRHRPQSLRARLIARPEHSLSERINITKQLARAISYVHALGFVHKNIRPENVVAFHIEGHRGNRESVFLAGFGEFRADRGGTDRAGDERWERNLYRHPKRQGTLAEHEFLMQHDIYSLGVCLLEIGLWTSFVAYDALDTPSPGELIKSSPLARYVEPREMAGWKDALVATAKKHLPPKMGDRYCDIVVNCLTCLDDDNADFADLSQFEEEREFKAQTGIQLGVKYMEKIMLELEDIEL